MTPKTLRTLADCLEEDFMSPDHRKAWANALRHFAKDIERSVIREEPGPDVGTQREVADCPEAFMARVPKGPPTKLRYTGLLPRQHGRF